MPVGGSRNVDRDEKLVGMRGRLRPGPPRDPRSRPSGCPVGERSVADAPKQTSGPPVSIAGDAFIRLPPTVPCARVAWEPTIAQASASAVKRCRTGALAAISAWRRERAEPEATVGERLDAAELGDRGGSRRCCGGSVDLP